MVLGGPFVDGGQAGCVQGEHLPSSSDPVETRAEATATVLEATVAGGQDGQEVPSSGAVGPAGEEAPWSPPDVLI